MIGAIVTRWVAGLILFHAASALAGERAVCRLPTVVDEISRQVKSHNYYTRVDARLITEQATPDPHFVHCNVCVLSAPYNLTRLGERQILQCQPNMFEVQIVAHGFVVRDLR